MTPERTCPRCGYSTDLDLPDAPVCPRCGSAWVENDTFVYAAVAQVSSLSDEVASEEAPADVAIEAEPDSSLPSTSDSVGEFFRALGREQGATEEPPDVVIRADSADVEEPGVFLTPEPLPEPEVPEAATGERRRRRRREQPQQMSWIAVAAIYLCGAMTGFVIGRLVYGPAAQSPLREIPDYGVRQGGRKWVLPDPSAAVPSGHWLRLNRTTRVGDLEITPLRVFVSRLAIVRLNPVSGQVERIGQTEPTVVLALKIKNVSKSLAFSPLDEMFLRPSEFPDYTYIELPDGQKVRMYPLPKFSERGLENQTFEELPPGEEREVWIAADPSALEKLRNTMVWRVQLRAGGTPEKTYATVVALKFSVRDIDRTGERTGA